MLAKRIVPCLDVRHGEVVKGVRFEALRAAGNAVTLAERYVAEGADELVLLDVVATQEARAAFADVVSDVARVLSIPFTVGGGIADVATARRLIEIGADKVSINSAALRRPELITAMADEFGAQAVVVAIDAQWSGQEWQVRAVSGTQATGRTALDWAREAVNRGAGELLITSMSHDGVKSGFALDLISEIGQAVTVPIVASGGAGNVQHFIDVFAQAGADAALAASVFHYGEIAIPVLKRELRDAGIEVRLVD
jgi:imidazole glycerol-phosphate synthase subunit HisF